MSPAPVHLVADPLPAVVRVSPWDDPRGRPPRPRPPLRATSSSSGCPCSARRPRGCCAGSSPASTVSRTATSSTSPPPPAPSVSASPRERPRRSPRPCIAASCSASSSSSPGRGWCAGGCRSISQRHLLRLPPDLQTAHEQWTTTTIHIDSLARAHALATAMLAAGDDRSVLEPQLVAVGVPPPAAAEACELLRDAQQRTCGRRGPCRCGTLAGGHDAPDAEPSPRESSL